MNGVKGFLQAEVKLMRMHFKDNPRHLNGWYSTGHFVLKNGRCWDMKAPLPDGVKPMKLGECFRNAAEVALGWHRNELIYCEGYASSMIPMAHAWLVDLQGRVVDPTWARDVELPHEYYGIAIKAMYLQEHLVKYKRYGLIDAWDARWPMLQADPKEWRHPINDYGNPRTKRHHPATCAAA